MIRTVARVIAARFPRSTLSSVVTVEQVERRREEADQRHSGEKEPAPVGRREFAEGRRREDERADQPLILDSPSH
jgi:hypothetical protein